MKWMQVSHLLSDYLMMLMHATKTQAHSISATSKLSWSSTFKKTYFSSVIDWMVEWPEHQRPLKLASSIPEQAPGTQSGVEPAGKLPQSLTPASAWIHALASSRINKTEEILSPKLKCSIPFSSSKSWFCLIQMLGSPLDIYLFCCHGVDSCIGRLRSQNSGNCQEIS